MAFTVQVSNVETGSGSYNKYIGWVLDGENVKGRVESGGFSLILYVVDFLRFFT